MIEKQIFHSFIPYSCNALLILLFFLTTDAVFAGPQISGCEIFPADNTWNTPIDTMPIDPHSDDYIDTLGRDKNFHPDFGSGIWNGGPIGIPFDIVDTNQSTVPVTFTYSNESDPGPYPIPANPSIEGGVNGTGDRHILLLEKDSCRLFELFNARYQSGNGWHADSGAVYGLSSNTLRPDGWTSSDAAGLPVLPGLIRYNEVAAGEIKHAIRFTGSKTRNAYVWPARHSASSINDSRYPPMGQTFRLKSSFDISGYSTVAKIILKAMKKYGIILADNGSSWFFSGAPDQRWDDNQLRELKQLKGNDFEAVDISSLIVNINSGQVRVRSTSSDLPPKVIIPLLFF